MVSLLSRALWRDLGKRSGQLVSVGIVIALGVALFAASFDAFLNLTASYEQMYTQTRLAHVTAIGGPVEAILAAAEAQPGVEATATRTVADVPLRPREGHTLLGRIVGLPPDGAADVNQVIILRGTSLDATRTDGVLMERHMAAHFGLEPGDHIDVATTAGWQPVEILGIAASPEYIWPARSRQELLVLPDDFGVIYAAESFVADLAPDALRREALVRLADDASAQAVEDARAAVLAAGAADAFTLAEQPSNAALQEDVAGFAEMSVLFPVFFLIAAAFATYVLLGRMIAAQQANIGTLRALGYRSRTILRQFAAIGLVLGLVGASVGVIGGALLAEVVTRVYTGVLGIEAQVIEVRVSTIVVGLGAGLLTGIVAAVFPARAASRISPATAMRGSLPPGIGGRSLVERIIPSLRALPVRWLVAIRESNEPGAAARRPWSASCWPRCSCLSHGAWSTPSRSCWTSSSCASRSTTCSCIWAAERPRPWRPRWPASLASLPWSWHSRSRCRWGRMRRTYSTTLTALQSDTAMRELVGSRWLHRGAPGEGLVVGGAPCATSSTWSRATS